MGTLCRGNSALGSANTVIGKVPSCWSLTMITGGRYSREHIAFLSSHQNACLVGPWNWFRKKEMMEKGLISPFSIQRFFLYSKIIIQFLPKVFFGFSFSFLLKWRNHSKKQSALFWVEDDILFHLAFCLWVCFHLDENAGEYSLWGESSLGCPTGTEHKIGTRSYLPTHSLSTAHDLKIPLFTGGWPRCMALSLLLIHPNTPRSKKQVTINSLGSFKSK